MKTSTERYSNKNVRLNKVERKTVAKIYERNLWSSLLLNLQMQFF